MAVVTMLLYEALARATGGPRIARHAVGAVERRIGDRPDLRDLARRSAAERLGLVDAFTQLPASFADTVAVADESARVRFDDGEFLWGWTGLATMSAAEVSTVLRGLPSGPPRAGPRWELWPLEDGRTVLVPGDDGAIDTVDLLVLLRHRSAPMVRLRRLRVGTVRLANGTASLEAEEAPAPAALGCEPDFTLDDDDHPYEGTCTRTTCGDGCRPLVHVNDDTGVHTLEGCICPAEAGNESDAS